MYISCWKYCSYIWFLFSLGIWIITDSVATFPIYSIPSLPFKHCESSPYEVLPKIFVFHHCSSLLGFWLCLIRYIHAHLNDIDMLFLGIGCPKIMVAGTSLTITSQAHCRRLWVPSPTRITCESQTKVRAVLMTIFSIIRLCASQRCRDISQNAFTGPLDALLGQLTSLQTLWENCGSVCGCVFTFTCANPHPLDIFLAIWRTWW